MPVTSGWPRGRRTTWSPSAAPAFVTAVDLDELTPDGEHPDVDLDVLRGLSSHQTGVRRGRGGRDERER